MIDKLITILNADKNNWNKFQDAFIEREITSKTVLLREGEIANKLHFIKKGCLREVFNKDGKDITFQFFFENQSVASFDSFINNKPSVFSIESIEPSQILSIKKEDLEEIFNTYPELKDKLLEHTFQRIRNYTLLFLSRIKDSPQERYTDLLENHPEIILRVPQHYIASFLGITPISLSRIRNRTQK